MSSIFFGNPNMNTQIEISLYCKAEFKTLHSSREFHEEFFFKKNFSSRSSRVFEKNFLANFETHEFYDEF